MSWTDDEIDELLVRYLDRELSSAENDEFERHLASDRGLREKLSSWQVQREGLRDLHQQTTAGIRLPSNFADRVIAASQNRVRELEDPTLAPWILRAESERKIIPASRLPRIKSETILKDANRRELRRWRYGVALTGLAASLLAIAFWSMPPNAANSLLSKSDPNLAKSQGPAEPGSQNAIQDSSELFDKTEQPNAMPGAQGLANDKPNALPIDLRETQPNNAAIANTEPRTKTTTLEQNSPGEMRSIEVASSTVGLDLSPSAEQLKAFERMASDPNGMFLLVIDIGLPSQVVELDALRRILDRHDIAWASELEIDDAVQANLVKSRLIAEAGKKGLIPDFVDPNSEAAQANRPVYENEVVSLVFVKARGARLDAAIIEVMRQTDEFPVFSFDLAFDAPTHALLNELRFIQEASLPPANVANFQSVSNVIRRSTKSELNAQNYFGAGPRRSKEMGIEARRQSRLPLDAETMNPIAYALFVVRHSERDSAR